MTPAKGTSFTPTRLRFWSHEADLTWFFSRGQSAFERSTFGDMLARAEQYAFDEEGARIEHAHELDQRCWEFHQGLCYRQARTLSQEMADVLRELIDWEALDPSVTARPPSTKSKDEPSYEPNDATLRRYAVISRALARIQADRRRALSLYFGLRGDRWAGEKAGRILVLYAETPAGRALLETSRRADEHQRPDERLAELWTLNRGWKDEKRSRLLERAEEQAWRLLVQSKKAYEQARGGR